MNHKIHLMTGAALAVLALAPALSAHAQTAPSKGVEEVIVTATKTGATNLQKTPLSVDVVGGNTLVQDDIKNARDLTNEVSGLMKNMNPPRLNPSSALIHRCRPVMRHFENERARIVWPQCGRRNL